MKTTSLNLSKNEAMLKLIELLRDQSFRNTQINLSHGLITTDLKLSPFKKRKIRIELKSPSETITQIKVSANRILYKKAISDHEQEGELLKKIESITHIEKMA